MLYYSVRAIIICTKCMRCRPEKLYFVRGALEAPKKFAESQKSYEGSGTCRMLFFRGRFICLVRYLRWTFISVHSDMRTMGSILHSSVENNVLRQTVNHIYHQRELDKFKCTGDQTQTIEC